MYCNPGPELKMAWYMLASENNLCSVALIRDRASAHNNFACKNCNFATKTS